MTAQQPSNRSASRRRTWMRRIALAAVALTLLLAIVVALLPTLLSSTLGRNLALHFAAPHVHGEIALADLSLSWSGPQVIGGLSITGADGASIALDITADNALLALVRQSQAPRITLSGAIATTYRADGSLSITELFVARAVAGQPTLAPAAASPKAALPSDPSQSLAATLDGLTLDIAALTITATSSETGRVDGLKDLKGTFAIEKSGLRADFSATTHVGEKSGSLAIRGVVHPLFAQDGSIDLTESAVEFDVTASELALSITGGSIVVPSLSLKISSQRLASEVAVTGTTTIQVPTGESATLRIDVSAKSPLEPSESSFSGSIAVDGLSTTALAHWMPAGMNAARDIGPTVSLNASLEGRSGAIEINSTAVQLKVRGSLDATGHFLALSVLDLHARIDPALLPAGARPAAATAFTLTGTGVTIPLGLAKDPSHWKQVKGEIDLSLSPMKLRFASAPAAATSPQPDTAPVQCDVGATRMRVTSSDFTRAVTVAVTTSFDGAPLSVDQVVTKLVGATGVAVKSAHATGSISIGSLSLATAQWLPESTRTLLAECALTSIAGRVDLDASLDAGSAMVAFQLSDTSLATKVSWNEESLSTDPVTLSTIVSPALVAKFAPATVALTAPMTLALRTEPLSVTRAALATGRAIPAHIKCVVSSPLIEIARAPGLTHGAQLRDFTLSATVAARADGALGGIQSSASAKILDAGRAAGAFSATFAMNDFAAPPFQSTLDLTVESGEILVQMVDAKEASVMLAGPGRVQGSYNRAAASDAFTAKIALPRLTLNTTGTRSATAIDLAATTATFDLPAALLAQAHSQSQGESIIGSLAIESLRWTGKADDASVVMSAVIEPGSFTSVGRAPITFGQVKLQISSPRLAQHAKASLTGDFTVGKSIAGPLALDIDARGDLRSLLGESAVPLTLTASHVSIKAPGALALALAQWSQGATAAPLAITQLGDISAEIKVNALTLPGAAIQMGSIDATIALAPTSITPTGKTKVTLGATTCSVNSKQLDQALTASLRSTVQVGAAAASALALSINAQGDLRSLLGSSAQPLTLRESTVQVQTPGALVLALVDWSSGTSDATSALSRVGDVNTTLAIKSLTLSPTAIAQSALDATLTLAALDIQPKGKPVVSVGATTIHVQSPRLADSVALTIASGGPHGGSIAVNASATHLMSAAGAFDPLGASWTAHAQARAVTTALVDAMTGQGGQLVEALGPTLDATVDTKRVDPATGIEQTQIAATLKTQFLDIAAPNVLISGGHAIVTAANPLRCTFMINPVLQRRLLEPLNPVLADIRSAPPIVLSVSNASYPLDGKLATLDLDARIEVGDVQIVRSNQVLGVMLLAQQGDSATIPAQIQPLVITVRAGQLKYQDFIVHAGKLGEKWQQTLKLSGDINLARTPPYANAITCRYPLASLARSVGGASNALSGTMIQLSNAISALPIDPGELVQADITLSGPLGEVDGKKVPLQSNVKLVFDASAINAKQVEKGLRDIGGTLDKLKGLFGK